MTFQDAFNCLMNGQKVRCKCWHSSYYIEFEGGGIHEYSNNSHYKERRLLKIVPEHEEYFSVDNILNEREVYNEELMPLIN